MYATISLVGCELGLVDSIISYQLLLLRRSLRFSLIAPTISCPLVFYQIGYDQIQKYLRLFLLRYHSNIITFISHAFRKNVRKIRTDQSSNELSFLNTRVHVDDFLYEYEDEHVLVDHGDVYETLYVIMNSRKQFLQSLLQKELL